MSSDFDFPIQIATSETLSALPIRGLAVDIDETLSDTMMEWVTRALVTFGNPENLTPAEFIAKYRYIYRAPYLATPEVEAWRREQKYSNELQTRLPLIPGALEGLRAVHRIIPVSCYVTARPGEVMDGTRQWLMDKGFPPAPLMHSETHVDHAYSAAWKASLLDASYPGVLGLIDDYPAIAEELPSSYQGKIFVYNVASLPGDSVHAYACPDWPAVVEKVREAFPS